MEPDISLSIPKPGDLKWAKLGGHPWWPCIVCNCPESLTHVKEDGAQIHVQFYYSPPCHAWIKAKSVRPFEGKDSKECKKGGLFHSNKKALVTALGKADKAQFQTVQERLAEACKSHKSNSGRKPKRKMDEDDAVPSVSSKKAHTEKLPVKYRPGPKSKMRRPPVKGTFSVKDKIPKDWKTAFVLMNTSDIPENLTPTGYVVVEEPVRESLPEETITQPQDADEDANKQPAGEGNDELELSEEEEIFDSDEDPGWEPSSNKAGNKALEKQKKTKLMRKTKLFSPKSKQPKKTMNKQSSSTASSNSSVDASAKKTSGGQPDSTNTTNTAAGPQILHNNKPTGPEPEIGDFLVEIDECKDNDIPHLWRYKRSGLIQKYGKIVEQDKVLYENLLNYSDWWACYAHKYEKVTVQVMFKYRNKEKVALTQMPECVGGPRAKTTEVDKRPQGSSFNSRSVPQRAAGSTQEQEISSTTSDGDFQIGNFVLDMKDQRNMDNFPIWKIESQILIKKYEVEVKSGRMLHKPVNIYRGYKDIGKSYLPVKVKKVNDVPGDDYVEVTADSKPKHTMDSSTEESYDKNPLLRHFYVYLQVFLSQALEPGFLDEISKSQDSTYVFHMGEIDKIISQKSTNIERKVRWTKKIKNALHQCPYLREVNKPDEKKVCEAITDSEDTVEETVFLFGCEYDPATLKQSGNSLTCQEFRIGKTAISNIVTYHNLCHFRFNLYDRCVAKIKMVQETNNGEKDVTKIMDSCLENKAWVVQNFAEFVALVELQNTEAS